MPSTFSQGPLPGLVLVAPGRFPDPRGEFFETYKHSEYVQNGIAETFHQDNHSVSHKGVLRGLHLQRDPHAQAKLVRVVWGRVWDVVVDLRRTSVSFGRWFGVELSRENRLQVYIPPGMAHGFLVLSDVAEFCYKCSAEYDRPSETGLRWNDPHVAIAWPDLGFPYFVSDKDEQLPLWPSWAEISK